MSKIAGDISGLRKTLVESLEQIYSFEIPFGQVITEQLAQVMAGLTDKLNRELAVYLNRRGQVTQVAVGDVRTVTLPNTDGRRSAARLSGIRCIHTHPSEDSALSSVDLASLKEMRFDLMAALGVANGEVSQVSFGYIAGFNEQELLLQTVGPLSLTQFIELDLAYLTAQIERELELKSKTTALKEMERALLVGVEQNKGWEITDSLRELAQLTETAGAQVVEMVWQKRERPDAAFFIGRGKVQEINLLRQVVNANIIIFDDELSPAQQRNLEQALGTKVLDRTALILDIFAQRARTHEGKLQVELAQLKYNLPRLGGQGLVLSRLGGGIGTRGPGETKLEVDRRRIRSRITDIEREIDNIKKNRSLHRKRRAAARIPSLALVGYTNAGKSTLLNKLAAADVLAEDKLFATLDPTTRRVVLPHGQEVLITDTVGFIQKLPHQLIAAFRATLEEVIEADLLLHVVDASHPRCEEQRAAVYQVLRELEAEAKPTLTVFNKFDRLEHEHIRERLLREADSVGISALTGAGLDSLYAKIEQLLRHHVVSYSLLIPYQDSVILSQLYDIAAVQSVEYEEQGIKVKVNLPPQYKQRYSAYVIGDE